MAPRQRQFSIHTTGRLVGHLKARRIELKLTQHEVAKHLGVNRGFVSKTEQCDRRLDILETCRLARLYGVQMTYIEQVLVRKTDDCSRDP